MKGLLQALDAHQLQVLGQALGTERLRPPYSPLAVGRYVPEEVAEVVAGGLTALEAQGVSAAGLGAMIDAVAADRGARRAAADAIDVVSSGPEAPGLPVRDTGAVVRDLFSRAEHEVLAVGYAVYKSQALFQPLADRMAHRPDLKVRLLLDIRREGPDTSAEAQVLARFLESFRHRDWPGQQLPRIYYDPRALELDRSRRASLHAKCVVIDRQVAFVSSANFTEAAQVRNIELGLLVTDAFVAGRIAAHFDRLIDVGVLRPLQ